MNEKLMCPFCGRVEVPNEICICQECAEKTNIITPIQETKEINFDNIETWEDFKAILKECQMFITMDKDKFENLPKEWFK